MIYKTFHSSDTNVSKFVFEWAQPKVIAESVLWSVMVFSTMDK